jgi:hydroxyacylglutathione hydrolase
MNIKKILLGFTNSYLLEGDRGYIMVDAGVVKQGRSFWRGLKHHQVDPGQIKLIIITHAHFDHVGSLAAIKALCGDCPVLIHPFESPRIAEPVVAIPPGINLEGKIISSLGRIGRPLLKFPPVRPEILFDQEFDLAEYGIDGQVLHTPGHTAGSLSILLADGQAIVGDLAVNIGRTRPFPPFAEEPEQIYTSWQQICAAGAAVIYPAHGSPFPAEVLLENLDGRNKGE